MCRTFAVYSQQMVKGWKVGSTKLPPHCVYLRWQRWSLPRAHLAHAYSHRQADEMLWSGFVLIIARLWWFRWLFQQPSTSQPYHTVPKVFVVEYKLARKKECGVGKTREKTSMYLAPASTHLISLKWSRWNLQPNELKRTTASSVVPSSLCTCLADRGHRKDLDTSVLPLSTPGVYLCSQTQDRAKSLSFGF